ncbi:hypothetical protein [Flavobacterium alkalisoli]|uniref:hypothetical protein n=1 Tax=Flavobacterium alkalisoli TaxID=2602769 RepID=UPI003A8FF690
MIKIDKGSSPPNLTRTNTRRKRAMSDAYDGNPNNYINAIDTFNFGSAYNTEEVRERLILKQHNKCCFSEAKFQGDYSDVEHFRPKGRVDDYVTNVSSYPGYYWLAYDWGNLFLCKTRPNTSQKRNYFPLYNEAMRNRCHTDTNVEDAKLINPGNEEPRDFIRFHRDEPRSVDARARGQFNIDFFDLRHSEFAEGRRTRLKLLEVAKKLVDRLLSMGVPVDDPEIVESLDVLREAISPEAEYSSMAIDFLHGWAPLQ